MSLRRPTLAAATLVAAALALSACAKPEPRTTGFVNGIPLGDYVLVGIANGGVPLRNVTLSVVENGVSGRAPCNGYAAQNTVQLPALALEPIRTTDQTCKDQALETRFLNALQQATEMEYFGGVLRIKGPTWLIFEAGVPASGETSSINALDAARGGQ